jgi:hypothetical protein
MQTAADIAPPRHPTECLLPRCHEPAVGMKSGSGRYEARCLPHALVQRRADLAVAKVHVDALEAMAPTDPDQLELL